MLNSDTLIMDGAIDRLLAFAAERPDAKIWGGRTLLGNRTLDPASCWRRMTLWSVFCRTFGLAAAFPNSNLFNAEGYGGWDRSTEREVDIVTGCFLLIEKELWQRLRGFDPRFLRTARSGSVPARRRARRETGSDTARRSFTTVAPPSRRRPRRWSACDRQGRAHQAPLPADEPPWLILFPLWPFFALSVRNCHRRSQVTTRTRGWRRDLGKFGSAAGSGASACAEAGHNLANREGWTAQARLRPVPVAKLLNTSCYFDRLALARSHAGTRTRLLEPGFVTEPADCSARSRSASRPGGSSTSS